jgi:TP901 family phage tail tape measure protein
MANSTNVGSIYYDLKLDTGDFDRATSSVGRKLGWLSGTFKTAAKGVAVAGAAFTAFAAKSVSTAAAFESQMSDIATLMSGDSTDAINKMKDGILGLTSVIPKSADDLGASAYQIVSAGITDTAEALNVLEQSGRLAVAGLSTTEEATDILTSAINAFGYEASEADMVADILFKTVKSGKTTIADMSQAFGAAAPVMAEANVELSEFSAATAALTTSGLPASQAQNSLRQAVVSLIKPTEDMKKLMDELGFESAKTAISQHGLVEVMRMVSNAADGNDEMLAKAWGSVEAIGVAASLTGQQYETFVKTLDDMEVGAASLDEAFMKQQQTFESTFQLLKNKLNTKMIELGSIILPKLITVMQYLSSEVLPAIVSWFQRVWPAVQDVARSVAEYLAPKLQGLFEAIQNNLIPALKQLWGTELAQVAKALGVTLVVSVGAATDALAFLISNIQTIINLSNNPLTGALMGTTSTVIRTAQAISWMVSVVSNAIGRIQQFISWLRNAPSGLNIVTAAIAVTTPAFRGLATIINLVVSNLQKLINIAGKVKNAAKEITDSMPTQVGGGGGIGGFAKNFSPIGQIENLTGWNVSPFAEGVRNFRGGMALVGEEGPELVNLPKGSDVMTNSESFDFLNNGSRKVSQTNFNGSITINDRSDAMRIMSILSQNQELAGKGFSV